MELFNLLVITTNRAHLEFWLGATDYGNTTTVASFAKLLSPTENGIMPRLQYLGIRNAENIDALVPSICCANIIKRIRILDLSLGELSTAAARLLYNQFKPIEEPYPYQLMELLDLHHNSVQDEQLIKDMLCDLPFVVDMRGNSDERYIAVGE